MKTDYYKIVMQELERLVWEADRHKDWTSSFLNKTRTVEQEEWFRQFLINLLKDKKAAKQLMNWPNNKQSRKQFADMFILYYWPRTIYEADSII